MNNLKGFVKNNKKLITLILLVTIFLVICSSFIVVANNKKIVDLNNSVLKIEKIIADGNYEEAIITIDSLVEFNKGEIINKLDTYKDLLLEYTSIDFNMVKKDLSEVLINFNTEYKDVLISPTFYKLNEDISNIESEIKEYYVVMEKEEANILESINNNVDEVKNLIKSFKEQYPNEDISELEKQYNDKIKEIDEEKSILEKSEIEEKESYDNLGDSEPKIDNTRAAQNSNQIITVVSSGGSYGEVILWEKDGNNNWNEVDRASARLGANGMKYASDVYEMDKCTPTGAYSLTESFGINANPGSGISYRQLDGSEYWVDDVDSEYYNTMQFGEPNGRWNSAEKLNDFPGYYNYTLVVDYNRWPVVAGKSSAIFLHCDIGTYTYGCIAIEESVLIKTLQWLNPASNPVMLLDFSYEDIYNNY